jgi:hypothetical protein
LIWSAKLDFLFSRQKSSSWVALVGAKVGANVRSNQAMPGNVQPPSAQVNVPLGDVRLRPATGLS